jgi:FkbM family methyltransferase
MIRRARWWLIRAARRILFPEARLVFGYLAEDLIASRLLASHRRTGFYVDVGCNDPFSLSNTFLLWNAGWQGINIDANPAIVQRMGRARPGDRNVVALIGNPGEARSFTIFRDHAKSTADPSFAMTWGPHENVAGQVSLVGKSLTDVLGECAAPRVIDFLNIDVEGMELEVLHSLDLAAHEVLFIAIEMHGFAAGEPAGHPTASYLLAAGYRLLAYNGLTGFFARTEGGRLQIPGL